MGLVPNISIVHCIALGHSDYQNHKPALFDFTYKAVFAHPVTPQARFTSTQRLAARTGILNRKEFIQIMYYAPLCGRIQFSEFPFSCRKKFSSPGHIYASAALTKSV